LTYPLLSGSTINFSSCIDGADGAGEIYRRAMIDALDGVQREGDVNCLVSTCCHSIHRSEPLFFLCGSLSLAGQYLLLRGGFQPTGLMEGMSTLVLHNIPLHISQKDIRIYLTERLLTVALLYYR